MNNISFDTFWRLYPKKVDKKKAVAKWDKLKYVDQAAVIEDVQKRRHDEKWKAGFIPMPTTYLNGERWNDEINTGFEKKPEPTRAEMGKKQDDSYIKDRNAFFALTVETKAKHLEFFKLFYRIIKKQEPSENDLVWAEKIQLEFYRNNPRRRFVDFQKYGNLWNVKPSLSPIDEAVLRTMTLAVNKDIKYAG